MGTYYEEQKAGFPTIDEPSIRRQNLERLGYLETLATDFKVDIGSWELDPFLTPHQLPDGRYVYALRSKDEITRLFQSKLKAKAPTERPEGYTLTQHQKAWLEQLKYSHGFPNADQIERKIVSWTETLRQRVDAIREPQLAIAKWRRIQDGLDKPNPLHKQIDAILADGFYSFRAWRAPHVEFITAPISVSHVNPQAKLDLHAPLGRMLIQIDINTLRELVLPFEDNLFVNGYYHPFVSSSGVVCWGNVIHEANAALNDFDLYRFLMLLKSHLLSSGEEGNPYVRIVRFVQERAERANALLTAHKEAERLKQEEEAKQAEEAAKKKGGERDEESQAASSVPSNEGAGNGEEDPEAEAIEDLTISMVQEYNRTSADTYRRATEPPTGIGAILQAPPPDAPVVWPDFIGAPTPSEVHTRIRQLLRPWDGARSFLTWDAQADALIITMPNFFQPSIMIRSDRFLAALCCIGPQEDAEGVLLSVRGWCATAGPGEENHVLRDHYSIGPLAGDDDEEESEEDNYEDPFDDIREPSPPLQLSPEELQRYRELVRQQIQEPQPPLYRMTTAQAEAAQMVGPEVARPAESQIEWNREINASTIEDPF